MAKYKTVEEARSAIAKASKFKAATTINGWKKGDIVDIINPGQQHTSGGALIYVIISNGQAYNINLTQVDVLIQTKEQLLEDIKVAETLIAIATSKIKYMEFAGTEEFDENEFKVWNTLQVLKTKKTDFEKAKEIAKLINGN
jgi:hypothetical protein